MRRLACRLCGTRYTLLAKLQRGTMMNGRWKAIASRAVLALLVLVAAAAQAQTDPLPSWNDTPNKRAIVEFVRATTTPGSPQFVPAEERIATFDQDGTLWVEEPMYTQITFALDMIVKLAPQRPRWKTREPYRSIIAGNRSVATRFDWPALTNVLAASEADMTVDEYQALVRDWLATARHPRFKRPYTELTYQPMQEVLRHLRSNGFKTYIVTGGGQEFVRAFADATYGIPREQVVGTVASTKFVYDKAGKGRLVNTNKTLLLDLNGGKPEGIALMVGRRPLAAFGNSTGDQEMLEYAEAGDGARLMLLVHHDDAVREYAYGAKAQIGTLSDALMKEAKTRGWTVVSMKEDWKRIFAFEP
jgi:phosphoglycolate phosphatase-like HAD superfamily hydrolase